MIFAIAGGLFSLAGWRARKAEPERPGERKPVSRSHVLYMIAYLFMSLSIFLFALRGLLFQTQGGRFSGTAGEEMHDVEPLEPIRPTELALPLAAPAVARAGRAGRVSGTDTRLPAAGLTGAR